MSIASELLTVDQLDQFPNDGKRREIIGGELYVSPAPQINHQDIIKILLVWLYHEIEEAGTGKIIQGPVDVPFSDHDLVQPDIVGVRADRLDICRGNTVYEAPDFVVEVLSPSNESYDRVEKKRLCEANGVPEYWIIDPTTRDLTILRLTNGVYVETAPENGLLRSTAIVDLTIDPAALFARLSGQ
ncbi:MAG: Uma2 family endonuclease [Thermomicrobiales bacterium]|nr:Uma2 family endonuclease [Thermomicrobiales bacterium]